jgi:hypothetical protein
VCQRKEKYRCIVIEEEEEEEKGLNDGSKKIEMEEPKRNEEGRKIRPLVLRRNGWLSV